MDVAGVLIFVGALVFLSHLFVGLFSKTHIPDVLWLMLIGLLIGPILGIAEVRDFGALGKILTKITLVVILFEGGLEIRFDVFRRFLASSVFLTLTSYFLTFGALFLFFEYFTGFETLASMFCAAVLAGPAPSVVIPLLKYMKISDSTRTTLSLEATIGEAFCILLSLTILESFQVSEFTGTAIGRFVGNLLASFCFAVVIGVLSAYIWSLLLGRVRKLQNSLFTTPAFVFLVYGFAEVLSFSGPIAVLLFGMTMGNIHYISRRVFRDFDIGKVVAHTNSEKKFFSELVFLLKIFFFVYLGVSIEFSRWPLFLLGALVVLIILVCRWLSVGSLRSVLGWTEDEARRVFSMFPRGLAAAILGAVPLNQAIDGAQEIASVVNYSILLSILLTSGLVFWSSRLQKREEEQSQTAASA